jgi:endonuclease/exonuclease/phosphatase family metal-dependent hydrolase
MRLKFISLNLYEGGLLFENIIEFLKKENPDIIAFQEVNNGIDPKLPNNLRSMQVLSKLLPDYYHFFAPEILLRYSEGKIDIGNAIFSKFPISKEKTIFFSIPYGEYDAVPIDGDFSKQPKNMQCCEVEVDGTTLTICNLHGIWGLDGADNDGRLKMSDLIVEQIEEKSRVILAGDFNIKPNTQTIKNIEKHLVNVFKNQLNSTFNLKRKDLKRFPGYATAVVDMIFTSQDLQVLKHSCPNVDVSDHLPLIIEFDI